MPISGPRPSWFRGRRRGARLSEDSRVNQVPGQSRTGELLGQALARAEATLARQGSRALVVRLDLLATPSESPRDPLDRLLRGLGQPSGRLVVRTRQLLTASFLAELPAVRLLCLSPLHDPESALLTSALEDTQAVVIFEPPELLEHELWLDGLPYECVAEPLPYPTRLIRTPGPPALTLACIGPCLAACLEVLPLFPGCELVVPMELQPLRLGPFEDSLRRSHGRLLTVGGLGPSWPGELVASCSEAGWLTAVDCLPPASAEEILLAGRRLALS